MLTNGSFLPAEQSVNERVKEWRESVLFVCLNMTNQPIVCQAFVLSEFVVQLELIVQLLDNGLAAHVVFAEMLLKVREGD